MGKLSPQDVNAITKLYDAGSSIEDIAKLYDMTYAPMQRFFKKHSIKRRTLSEAQQISCKTGVGLKRWQEKNGSWYRGLDKTDPRVVAAIEKGRATQVRNGKNKGSKNPMYGRVAPNAAGYRKDLGRYFRSSWEANFARILVALGFDYVYEPDTFKLSDGTTYTPDFFVPAKNKYYEIKGFERNNKFVQFHKDFPSIRIKIVKEELYDRILHRFSNRITVEDRESLYTKDELIDLFAQYCRDTDKRPSVSEFCQSAGISTKTIKRMFGSVKGLVEYRAEEIKIEAMDQLRAKWLECIERNGEKPTYKEMQKQYQRTASILNNCFDGKYQAFVDWASTSIFASPIHTKAEGPACTVPS